MPANEDFLALQETLSVPAGAKAIKEEAWNAWVATCGGSGPELQMTDVCDICISQQMQQSKQEEESGAHIEAVFQQVEEDGQDPKSCQNGYYVSKTWLA
jgi:hypothetical protein